MKETQNLTASGDPFQHHPELRDRILDAQASFFRDFSVDRLIEQFPQMAEHRSWTYSDEQREALRAATLAGRQGDLWVFAYGSLMWDPALRFAEVRRASLQGYARRLILLDARGARGTAEAPGLMAALDHGEACRDLSCQGLAFRIAAADVERETEILWRREIVGPAYIADFVPATLDNGSVEVLAFLADHQVEQIRADLTREQQIHYIATGAGFLGSSHAYLSNIVGQFEALGIHDEDCARLLEDVEAYRRAQRLG